MRPSEIYYSQDSINNVFGNHCIHRNRLIGSTLDSLCDNSITVYSIPTIGVMQKNGRWYTADNRRLWVFRELERLGKCTEIPVRMSYIPENKFTTFNRGEHVRVRGHPGGHWHSRTRSTMSTYQQQPVQTVPILTRTRETAPTGLFDIFAANAQTFSSLPIYRPASATLRSNIGSSAVNQRPHGLSLHPTTRFNNYNPELQNIQSSLANLSKNEKYVDPQDCRYLKDTIKSHFDNGRTGNLLKQNLIDGVTSYRDIPAIKVFDAYDMYYVQDGNRRLKAFKDSSMEISGIRIKVQVIGDEDDLLDELRSEDPAITAFEVMQLGETVDVL